ncbi:hypothetical protein HK097_006802 [Rhizophlyctis rosea]|uniref:F-box domain-containing protein n=1 Tax=Rhizophlyctis rosea TaxID=64517 RepID=A0AAD5X6B4_9FUNG|nr:hypothetical protein HK097_006802 [Rhizophlyctis rosea]
MDPCHIARIPNHVLFQIFEHIQPTYSDDPIRIPTRAERRPELFTNDENRINLQYIFQLAQVCREWRGTAFRLREGQCLDLRNTFQEGTLTDEDHVQWKEGYDLFLRDSVRANSIRELHIMEPHGDLGVAVMKNITERVPLSRMHTIAIGRNSSIVSRK